MRALRWGGQASVLKSATATISGTGTLTATGVRVVSTTATLTGTGTLTAIGTAVARPKGGAVARPPQRPIPRVRTTRKRIKFTFTWTTTLHSQVVLEEPVALRCTSQGRTSHRSATTLHGVHFRTACRRTRLLTDTRVTSRARFVDPLAKQTMLLLAHLLTETPDVRLPQGRSDSRQPGSRRRVDHGRPHHDGLPDRLRYLDDDPLLRG